MCDTNEEEGAAEEPVGSAEVLLSPGTGYGAGASSLDVGTGSAGYEDVDGRPGASVYDGESPSGASTVDVVMYVEVTVEVLVK